MLDHWFSHLFAEDARDLRIVDAVDLGGDVTVVKNQHVPEGHRKHFYQTEPSNAPR